MDENQTGLSAEAILDLSNLINLLLKESERAVVIMAAARLDAELETLLKNLLIPNPGGQDSLFEGDRMLGSFSAKIGMAYRLGAIDNDFEHALQVLRKIRNDFAHQLDTESLSSSRQKQRLNILVRWAEATATFELLKEIRHDSVCSSEHLEFVCCSAIMVAMLHVGLKRLRRVDIGTPLSIKTVSQKRPTRAIEI